MFSTTFVHKVWLRSILLIAKGIYLKHLNISKNNEIIYGGWYYSTEAPHDFILNFCRVYLVSKIEFELNQKENLKFICLLVKNLPLPK